MENKNNFKYENGEREIFFYIICFSQNYRAQREACPCKNILHGLRASVGF